MTNSLHIAGFVVVASLVGCAVDAPPETAPETPTVASDRATVELTPALGRMMYPATDGMADPDPSMAATVQGDDSYAWALGVQPHVSIMQLALRGMTQVEPPYAINDITWPGTFTVDAGALTLVTLFTK